MVGCVLFTSLHGPPIRSYFVETEDKVTTLQSGYGVCAIKFWEDVVLSLVSTKLRHCELYHVILTSLPTLNKCGIITTVIFFCYH